MADGDAPSRDALLGILADATRLRIVEALGDLSERGEYSTIPFTDLQRAVGVDDNGRFSYHLDRLVGSYVRQSDRGYRLALPGIRVYQSLQRWGEEAVTVDPSPTPCDCRQCGDPLHCAYRDGRFRIDCPNCDHLYNVYPLDSGAFDPDDPDSLHRAAIARLRRDFVSMAQGTCPYCSGTVTMTVEGSDTPLDVDGPVREAVEVLHACEQCNWFVYSLAGTVLTSHPAVVSFLHDRGYNVFETAPWDGCYDTVESVASTDPLRIEVRFRCDGDELRLLVDRRLDALESEEFAGVAGPSRTD